MNVDCVKTAEHIRFFSSVGSRVGLVLWHWIAWRNSNGNVLNRSVKYTLGPKISRFSTYDWLYTCTLLFNTSVKRCKKGNSQGCKFHPKSGSGLPKFLFFLERRGFAFCYAQLQIWGYAHPACVGIGYNVSIEVKQLFLVDLQSRII